MGVGAGFPEVGHGDRGEDGAEGDSEKGSDWTREEV